ncbi:MAG: tetratricopeptide repeat protein [Myxococcales bacterium]|jgi:tetratricopeptide (TPR) repeat protein|nr:tetratricopeptide repeat protein [Myxococcales bacterium]
MFPAWLVLSALLSQTPSIPPQALLEKERGDNLASSNQLDAALRAYDAAISQAPAFAEALNQRGVTLVRLNRLEEALTSFDQALQIDPSYTMALYNRGLACKRLGRHEEVLQTFTLYTNAVQDDAGGFFHLAESNYVLGNVAAALRAYERFVTLETEPSQANRIEHSKKRIAELEAKLSTLAQTTPVDTTPPPTPTPAVENAKATAATSSASASVLIVTPEREALCNAKLAEGIALRANGQLRESIFALQDAAQANPQNARALYELGEAYAALNYFAQAATRWERVLTLNPPPALRAQVEERLPEAYRQMDARGIPRDGHAAADATPANVPVKARQKEAVTELVTSKPISSHAKAAFLKGTVLFADRDYAGAVRQYDIAIVIHPDVSELYSARAAAWLASNEPMRALADYTQARRYGPALALPLYGLAEAHFALQHNAEASEHYRLFLTSTAPDAKREMIDRAQRQIQLLEQKSAAGPKLQFGQ